MDGRSDHPGCLWTVPFERPPRHWESLLASGGAGAPPCTSHAHIFMPLPWLTCSLPLSRPCMTRSFEADMSSKSTRWSTWLHRQRSGRNKASGWSTDGAPLPCHVSDLIVAVLRYTESSDGGSRMLKLHMTDGEGAHNWDLYSEGLDS